jgi:hypothetical protein
MASTYVRLCSNVGCMSEAELVTIGYVMDRLKVSRTRAYQLTRRATFPPPPREHGTVADLAEGRGGRLDPRPSRRGPRDDEAALTAEHDQSGYV